MMRPTALFAWGLAVLLGACASTPGPDEVLGERTRVRITGNESLDEPDLLQAIREDAGEVRGPATRAQADDAAWAIEERYRREGFPEARVFFEHEEDAGGPVSISFRVEEGPRIRMGPTSVTGASAFETRELERFFPERGAPFVETRVRAGAGALEDFYRSKGYLGASVGSVEIVRDQAQRLASAEVALEEGPRFHLREIELVGAEALPEELRERIQSDFLGTPFTPRLAFSIRARILDGLFALGRPDAETTFETTMDHASGDVRLSFQVEPGPEVFVAEVRIEGARETQESEIRSLVTVQPGDRFDPRKVRRAFDRLFRTGLYDTVKVELAPGSGSERALLVTVEEAPTWELFVEPGLGSYEGPRLKLGVVERDFLQEAIRVSAETAVSPKAQGIELEAQEPWLLDSAYGLSGSIFGTRREEPSFTFVEYGTRWGLSRDWTSTLETTLQYELRLTELEDVDVELAPEGQEILEDVDVSSISVIVVRDGRDHPLIPEDGSRTRAEVEWAGTAIGSEIDFVAGRLSHSTFLGLTGSTVLGLGASTGVIVPLRSGDEIPLTERFFNGGENSVRSFAESELGPLDANGDPIGGEAFTTLSVELRQRLKGNFSGALFYDLGNVTSDHEDTLDLDGFRSGVGVGLRYLLPIGPLRLDAGFNPSPRDDEDDFVLHFSVGMPF